MNDKQFEEMYCKPTSMEELHGERVDTGCIEVDGQYLMLDVFADGFEDWYQCPVAMPF